MTTKMLNRNQVIMCSLLLLGLWFLVFHEGITTAVDVWYTSEIYNHCFLVLPCISYFIYQKQQEIIKQPFRPNFLLLVPLVGVLIVQLFASIGSINILMHIATFTALPIMIWLVIGNRAAQEIAWPLGLFLFCIPIGDQLIPHLQELTTDISVPMLELTGVPIYRNGLYLDIPEGRFLVAEACSGISFLITSIAFGFIYSYVSFHSIKKRAIFIAVSIAVPILANAIRVYGIILTGHLTNMEHAVGADHLIYGGVFYGIVLLILILIGERFRDEIIFNSNKAVDENIVVKQIDLKPVIRALIIMTAVSGMQYTWLLNITNTSNDVAYWTNSKSESALSFEKKANSKWQPELVNTSNIVEGNLNDGGSKINFYGAYFNEVDAELISSQHRLFDGNKWSLLSSQQVNIAGRNINQVTIISPIGVERYVYYWYQFENTSLTSQTKVKLYQAYKKLLGEDATGNIIMLSYESNPKQDSMTALQGLIKNKDDIVNSYYSQLNLVK